MRIFLFILLLTLPALAQTAPAPITKDAKIEKPALTEITLPAESVKSMQEKGLIARNAALQADNLRQAIELAQFKLKELQAEADKAQQSWLTVSNEAFAKAGIPESERGQWEPGEMTPDGGMKWRKKAKAAEGAKP